MSDAIQNEESTSEAVVAEVIETPNAEVITSPVGESVATDGFALRSIFQPNDGFYIGISPISSTTESGFELDSYLKYADVAHAAAELRACLDHAERTLQAIIYQQGFEAGRQAEVTGAQISDVGSTEAPVAEVAPEAPAA